jgi:GTP-binding protein Era
MSHGAVPPDPNPVPSADLPPGLLSDLPVDLQAGLPPDHRSGFIAVVGRPNAGKSTLLNRLLGQKIAITSPKPQTTRDQLLGILTTADAQYLFLDTPGIHKPLNKLGEYMVTVAGETIEDADVVLWLVNINVPPTAEDSAIAELLLRLHRKHKLPPLVLGFNHADHWSAPEADTGVRINQYVSLVASLVGQSRHRVFAKHPAPEDSVSEEPVSGAEPGAAPMLSTAIFSAATGIGVPPLQELLRSLLPPGPRYYPEDQVTDLQLRFIAGELIREKALLLLQDEVPHSMAVEVDEFIERGPNLTYISAVIYLERESQKPIVLGKDGTMIKRIGQTARPEIEELVGTKVYLELWVKVWERWRRRDNLLRQLGYATARKKAT